MIGRRTFVVTSLLLALSILCSFRIISKSVVLVEESRVGIAPTRQMLRVVPLQDLAQSSELGNCQNGLFPLSDVIHSTIEDVKHSRIPPVLHQTGKTRCVAFDILNLTETWKTLGYEYYFHNDDAVDRLIRKHSDTFPQLAQVFDCVTTGAGIADLWRYLILWE